ncbi:MAG: energy transducer TonB [Deltaproteobacteria bacterium]
MRLQLTGFCLSAVIHGTFILLFVLLQLWVAVPERPAVIDFTFAGDASPAREMPTQAPAAASRRAAAVQPKKIVREPGIKEAPAREPVRSGGIDPSPAETISPAGDELAGPGTEAIDRVAEGSGETGAAPAVSPVSPDGPGGAGMTAEQSRAVYLREHFVYIRDRINRSILYPETARRMGWCGQVKIAFVVCEDGGVNEIRVVDGSGFGLLDRNAVDTVKRVAPFPRPPVRAEIRMAVTYRLN